MSAWDQIDGNTLGKQKIDPELFRQPLVQPPSRRIPGVPDLGEEEPNERA